MIRHKELFDSAGSVFSFLSTLFYIRASVLAWPMALIASSINMYLYLRTGLYGDMSLEGFYFLSTFYGWYEWLHGGKNKKEIPITHITKKMAFVLSIISIAGILLTELFLSRYTNSRVPWLDSTTTVLSLVAQFLICRKIIETWILWFIVDAVYAGLYFYKTIPIHGVLLIIYVGLAVLGYIRWHKKMYLPA